MHGANQKGEAHYNTEGFSASSVHIPIDQLTSNDDHRPARLVRTSRVSAVEVSRPTGFLDETGELLHVDCRVAVLIHQGEFVG